VSRYRRPLLAIIERDRQSAIPRGRHARMHFPTALIGEEIISQSAARK
jgi:hypothetical protein